MWGFFPFCHQGGCKAQVKQWVWKCFGTYCTGGGHQCLSHDDIWKGCCQELFKYINEQKACILICGWSLPGNWFSWWRMYRKAILENTAVSLEINNNILHIRIQGPRNGLALMKVIFSWHWKWSKSSLN